MNIDSIKNGIVIDHISAGKSMEIYNYLKLDSLGCPVAVLQNVKSNKMGRKDIMKIDSDTININFDVLGYIDPDITVNIIKDGKIAEKKHLELPREMVNVLFCSNPRCITSTEPELDHIFRLTDKKTRTYRCAYCESKSKNRQD